MSKQIKISDEVFESLKKNKKKLSFSEYFRILLKRQAPETDRMIIDLKKLFYEHSEVLKPVYRSESGFVNAILKDISLYEDGIENFNLEIVKKGR